MSTVAAALLLSFAATAQAGDVKIASGTASSTFPPQDGSHYEVKQLFDGRLQTSWVEGEDGSGLGSWVEIDLGGEKAVKRIKVWGGLWYSNDYYHRANRPKELEVKFSDGTTEVMTLADEMVPQVLELAKAHKTSTLRFKVKSVHTGTTWLDSAISEIQVFDDTDDTALHVASYKSSSQLKADDDGSYDAVNVGDGLTDSMWCEGVEGDGNGEWMEFDFGSTRSVKQLDIINGIGASMGLYMKANRPKTATLTFSDGGTESVVLKPVMFMSQSVSFPAHATRTVRLTFGEVVPGKEFNDLCVSEAAFR